MTTEQALEILRAVDPADVRPLDVALITMASERRQTDSLCDYRLRSNEDRDSGRDEDRPLF